MQTWLLAGPLEVWFEILTFGVTGMQGGGSTPTTLEKLTPQAFSNNTTRVLPNRYAEKKIWSLAEYFI